MYVVGAEVLQLAVALAFAVAVLFAVAYRARQREGGQELASVGVEGEESVPATGAPDVMTPTRRGCASRPPGADSPISCAIKQQSYRQLAVSSRGTFDSNSRRTLTHASGKLRSYEHIGAKVCT
eukprot:TRINITY_DN21432_c0_g1_i2.p1 TRINITY_DN21432_c0_g1~~TRINITY_DN21432_c0_g1_i2.p1  ORF type:complete len:124 (+),score=11.19 TRINITY_DN21432_c0_g1_i2:90-461(+)